jgi:hypothetical protein
MYDRSTAELNTDSAIRTTGVIHAQRTLAVWRIYNELVKIGIVGTEQFATP